ncbi:uncharacterized protein [Dysidea avara]|uniref:uncharacterized protein n=1 Tax=Dysidea avara TaxID=196820 RepID=UPI00332989C4
MTSEYFKSLDYLAQIRYVEKLTIRDEVLPDPYSIGEESWTDDMTQWPDLPTSLWTRTTIFCNGHVRTVYCYGHGNHVILKALVNPSQKTPDQAHKAWVILQKADAEVITAHCTCKAGLGEVCSHIAAILFKVETAVRLGLTKPSCTSTSCNWNNWYKENINPAEVRNINFVKPKHSSKRKQTCSEFTSSAKKQQRNLSQIPPETLYSAINNCLPHASVFTIVPKPDNDSQLSKVTSSVGTPIVDSVTDSGMISSSVDSSIVTTPVMESSVSPDTSTATTPMVESSSSPDTSMVTTPVVESSVSPDTSMVTTPVMESTTSSADASISSLVTTQVVPNIPKPLLELFDPKHKKLSKEMLLQLSKEVF